MFFQISPVVHKKQKPMAPKNIEDEESKVEILSLGPFAPIPKIAFEDVPIRTTHKRKLLVKNPTGNDIELFLKKAVPEEMNFTLSWTKANVKSNSELLLELFWNPFVEEASRYSFTLSDGKKVNRDIAVIFKSVDIQKSKKQNSKFKIQKPKSPVTVALKRKVSPVKKSKPQIKPTFKFSPKPKCSNYCSPPAAFKSQQENSSKHRFDIENKENFLSPNRKKNHNASASFRSPSNASFLLEKEGDGRRETFVLHDERRETYILQTKQVQTFVESKSVFSATSGTLKDVTVNEEDNCVFRDSLESPNLAVTGRNVEADSTPTLEHLLNNERKVKKLKATPNFEYKLKVLENFAFSPAVSPYPDSNKTFQPPIFSTASKPSSTNNSYENQKTVLELFPPNQTYSFNLSGETFTKGNVSSDTYVKGSESFETYVKGNVSGGTYVKGNVSGGTYVKDNSVGDLACLEASPVTSRLKLSPSPIFLKPRSFDLSPVVENNASAVDARLCSNLSSIAEEASILNESSLRIGNKRKSPQCFKYSPVKRERVAEDPKKNWSKSGGNAFRVSKSTSGLNLKKFLSKTDEVNTSQTISQISETTLKTVVVQNPFLYAHVVDPFMTSQIYCSEDWIEQQEICFTKWLNVLLTPPEELSTKAEVDVAKVWQECKKKDVGAAPTKEIVSLNYHTNAKLDHLRKQAQSLFRSKEIADVLQKVCLVVETGKLSIRTDKDLHLNLKLKSDILALVLGYNPLWLRIGLETIYNEVIPLKSNSDSHGLANFIMERFLKDPHLLKKHKTVYAPKYTSDLKKFLFKKFLILVYFLDKAKNAKLIQHDPCLFCKNASVKESKLVLIHFAKESLSAVGDVTKYLKTLGYIVTHVQSYIHEFDYAVKKLGVDLRDGVRLCKVMEIIQMRDDLTSQLRVPAISRLQKVHNTKLVFNSLRECGYEILYEIEPKDIVDGHKEKTLSFLWQIIYKFEAPLMVKSAKNIQTWFRSLPVALKRRKLRRLREQRENAARRIQLFYKHKKQYKIYASLALFVREVIVQRKEKLAAIKLQSFFKMVLYRKRYLIQYNAITKLQSFAKGWLIRNHYSQRTLAAKIIQKTFRGYRDRKNYLELRNATITIQRRWKVLLEKKKKRAAIKIQSFFKMVLCRKIFLLQYTAIVKLQAFSKGWIIRNHYRQRILAAKIIQKTYRGYRDRKKYIELRRATITVQKRWIALLEKRKKKAAIKIQSFFKMAVCRKRFLLKYSAIIKLQAYGKGWITRNHYRQKIFATKIIQKTYRGYRDRKKYIELRRAAITVQRRWIAILEKRKKRAAIKIQSFLKMTVCRKRFLLQYSAIVKLQAFAKGWITRNHYRKMIFAAKIIQKNYRSYRDRKKYIELRRATITVQRRWIAILETRKERAAIKIQSFIKMAACRKKFLLQYTAIIKLQAFAKGWITRNHYRQRIFAAKIIQKTYRGYRDRKNYLKLRKSAIAIQRNWIAILEMRKERLAYEKLRKTAIFVQTKIRSKKLMEIERYAYQNLKIHVLTIQRRFRANKAAKIQREAYIKTKSATVHIQNWYRSTKAMREQRSYFIKLKKSTIFVQQLYRAKILGQKARADFVKVKETALYIQSKLRANSLMKQQRAYYNKLKEATIIIQCWFKMKRQYAYYNKLKNAAVVLQQRYKAKLLYQKERFYFVHLKETVIFVQTRYKATRLMQQQRTKYISLREATIKIQRRFRANTLGKKIRNEYQALRNATLIVQRRFRANILAKEEKHNYLRAKNAALVIQQMYKAWKTMTVVRQQYLSCRAATITIQIKLKSILLMRYARKSFLKLRAAAIIIQKRFRARNLMLQQRNQYQNLKNATVFVQRIHRANKSAKVQRNMYLRLKWAVVTVQRVYRARNLAREQLEWYSKMKLAAVVIQRRFRAQKAMKEALIKYGPMLTPEAIEARKVAKMQEKAAVKIQAAWKGYSCRKSLGIDSRKESANHVELAKQSVPGKTLGQRCAMALQCMTNENGSLLQVLKALEDLDFITRHCRDSCIRLSHILPNQLYIIITSAARSLPEMSVCNVAAFILINFAKYPLTKKNSWDDTYMDDVINVLLHCCDKEAPMFSTLCTLLWLFAHEEEWKRVILALPNIQQRFKKIQTLVQRKHNMVVKTKKLANMISVCGPVVNHTLPTRTANWGLDYDRPNTFTNSVFAISCLLKILEIS